MITVFEGLDGSGKSTQVDLLVEYINKNYKGFGLGFLHEPRMLRNFIFEECKKPNVSDEYISYLFARDGIMGREEEMYFLKNGIDMIFKDRDIAFSQYAYHKNLGTNIFHIYTMCYLLNYVKAPNYIIFIDTPIDDCIERIKSRSHEKSIVDYFEKEEKLRKVYANYMELLGNKEVQANMGLDNIDIIRIPGKGSVKDVHNRVILALNETRFFMDIKKALDKKVWTDTQ